MLKGAEKILQTLHNSISSLWKEKNNKHLNRMERRKFSNRILLQSLHLKLKFFSFFSNARKLELKKLTLKTLQEAENPSNQFRNCLDFNNKETVLEYRFIISTLSSHRVLRVFFIIMFVQKRGSLVGGVYK